MVKRIWHGWTTRGNAAAYEALLKNEVFPSILGRGIPGLERIELLRDFGGEDVEFVTVITFSNMLAVQAFAGDDYEQAYVPPRARELLLRFDEVSRHYESRTEVLARNGDAPSGEAVDGGP